MTSTDLFNPHSTVVNNNGIYSNSNIEFSNGNNNINITANNNNNNMNYQPQFRWDPNKIRITSLAVERTLEPLVTQITSLVNKTGPSNQPKGQSKRAEVLVATMERAIEIFIQKGQEIASETSSFWFGELNAAIEDIRSTGHHMSMMSKKFVDNPCSAENRADIIKAARPLLLAVTRLLIVADMIDVQRLLNSIRVVENDLNTLKNASSQQEVLDSKDSLWNNTDKLMSEVDLRQPKDERSRFHLAAARAILKKNRTLLLTASKVYVRHPEISEAKKNRDFAFSQVCEAVNTITDVAQDRYDHGADYEANTFEDNLKNIGKLAMALDSFDRDIAIEPSKYSENEMRPKLEASLERIITASAAVADFVCSLKDDCRFCRYDKLQERQDLFVNKCNTVRQALQDLLSEYVLNADSKEPSDGLNRASEHMYKKTRDLRRHLRQAAVDHVSYRFLAEQTIVTSLVDAAKNGDEMSVEEYAQALRKNSKMLMDVAYLNCCMSTNEVGVDRVNHCIKQLERLSSQVVNAAKILSVRTSSKAAVDNMEEFQNRWTDQVQDLIDALHKIIVIDDLLALSELHTKEDKIDALMALQSDDKATFIRVGSSISNRFASLCKAVESEMNNYEKCAYTESVLKANAAMKKSKDTFDRFFQNISRTFGDRNRSDMNKADLERTTNELIVNLKQVRFAVRIYDELDSETEADYEDNTYETRSKSSIHTDIDEFPGVAGISNTRDAYRFISDEDKQKIAMYVENFRTEKNKFDQEVGKWDDNGNEIIAMAKKMCKIMMDMTDFTRGRGPLKTTMDIINAAKKISEYGTELDKIANLIAEQSPESETKRDLQGYLKEIALYCHQLNITSKVKAEVQNISGNLIVSGLDSATSLIQAAKNLMNAVISTVKASWVASTMYTQRLNGQAPPTTIVRWEVKVPEKKPLVRKERSGEAWSRIQRAPRKRNVAPLRILNEFSSSGST